MRKVLKLAEIDLASTGSPITRQIRREQISNTPSCIKRLGAAAIHTVVGRYPRVTAHILGITIPTYVGHGLDMLVLRYGDEVVKVNFASIVMSPAERQAEAANRQHNHDTMREYLRDAVEPHSVSVAPHPLAPSYDVITARQRFRTVRDSDLFGEQSTKPDRSALQRLRQTVPDIDTQLAVFAEASLGLYQNHGLLPDLSRPGNLMLCSEDNLVLIDGEPIRPRDPHVQAGILSCLRAVA